MCNTPHIAKWQILCRCVVAVIMAMIGATVDAQETKTNADTIYVCYRDGRIDVYPPEVLLSCEQNHKWLIIGTVDNEYLVEELTDIDSVTTVCPVERLANITQAKFKVKTNYNLMDEVTCDIGADSITAAVNSIGTWLTPEFKTSSADAVVYLDNDSTPGHETKRNFNVPVRYRVALPQHNMVHIKSVTQVSDDTTLYTLDRVPFGRLYTMKLTFGNLATMPVPRIYINIDGGRWVTSKKDYLRAEIIVDGMGVYPSMTDSVLIRGRGNSSWSEDSLAKNPYRLKFDAKKSMLGLKKGKNWVLLANAQRGSMMTNAVGMKVASAVGTAAWNHIVPVDLYMNGNYWGNYNLTEKIGFSNNSVDLPDESRAVLFELDAYYDAVAGQRFRSTPYTLPVIIHEPEFADSTTALTLATIKSEFNKVTKAAYYNYDMEPLVDFDLMARFIMVNELLNNKEILFPKSVWVYREDLTNDSSKWIFGPVWDWDWAFGYDNSTYRYSYVNQEEDFWSAKTNAGARFMKALRFSTGEKFDSIYYSVWKDFMENQLEDVLDYTQQYQIYVQKSFDTDYAKWKSTYGTYLAMANNTRAWLRTRSRYVFDGLTRYGEDTTPKWEGHDVHTPVEDIKAHTADGPVDVYDLTGRLVASKVPAQELRQRLPAGIYIAGRQKIIISK